MRKTYRNSLVIVKFNVPLPGLITHIFLLLSIWASVVAGSNGNSQRYLNNISAEDLQQCLQLGIDSVNRKIRLEDNLLNAHITVENGSISHAMLLDALPNAETKADNEIAKKLLASSLCIYNSKCLPNGVIGIDCEAFLAKKLLPSNTELTDQCNKIVNSRRNGHSSFRRVLPRHYKDAFYEMFTNNQIPSPLLISRKMHEHRPVGNYKQTEGGGGSLAIAQWAQFIEHDLSKPIVTSMADGSSIECCNRDNFELQPRYRHPACAPLIENSQKSRYGLVNCLSYVRSAVAVGSECTFGAVEQLNQATGFLDLSQLYGFTDEAKRRMRAYKNGEIKSSHGSASTKSTNLYSSQLPLITVNPHEYCAFKDNSNSSTCFMAGDSRVNNNPLSISIYTIFMRNHNQIARKLTARNPNWSDDRLYENAKFINIDIYRRIVFQEWLPVILGEAAAAKINPGHPREAGVEIESSLKISNEFAVAAIRFYFSMIPNKLGDFARTNVVGVPIFNNENNDTWSDQNTFAFSDQAYKPYSIYTAEKLNMILESSIYQPAMKMDSTYEESLILGNIDFNRPTHGDIFAFDIQRGRDHGLQDYVSYLNYCTNTKVNDWKDLEQFMTKEDINKLKSIYADIDNIDLIVGGISEMSANDVVVGPTFACLIVEQFSRILQWQRSAISVSAEPAEILSYKSVTAVDVLCANSDLQYVPKNIFRLISNKNPPVACDEHLQPLRF